MVKQANKITRNAPGGLVIQMVRTGIIYLLLGFDLRQRFQTEQIVDSLTQRSNTDVRIS